MHITESFQAFMYPLSTLVKRTLVCPETHQSLHWRGSQLVTADGRRCYPIVDGIPVLLSTELEPNFWVGDVSRRKAEGSLPLGEMPDLQQIAGDPTPINFVRNIVGSTSGHLYAHLTTEMHEYPIPSIRLPPGDGKLLVDVGSNWGRWVVAAARAGYTVVGIDIHLEGLRAARRVCAQLGVEALLICADARRLPLQTRSVDTVFSYSVLQHFSRVNFDLALAEISRVLRKDGHGLVQMPNRIGVRNLCNRVQNGFREEDFDVRYYFPSELVQYGSRHFGKASTTIDGFFGLGVQPSDRAFFTPLGRAVCLVSEWLRLACRYVPGSEWLADSLYLHLECPRELI
jgi:SAM-dependent methyltransferase